MLSSLGTGLVLLSLFFAASGSASGAIAGLRKNASAWEWTRNAAYGFSAAMILANFVMIYALLARDFSVSYVAEVGSWATPTHIAIASLWASLSGSILFWGGILGVYVALTVWSLGDKHRAYTPWALHVLLGISVFFCFLVASIANPFAPTDPSVLSMIERIGDGPGPNPLLQNHWLMILHPPTLYLGYVGMSVPFSLICAALLAGRLEAGWMVPVRRWMLIPWAFLSVGIMMGGWWSYEVLGWGGYWAWDPVENASFHPWLTGTAFVHSAMVLQRKGKLRDWTLILGMSTFLLTLLGTFMTRSGVFNSVHSFTQSPIGPVFLVFIGITLTYSIVLLALRAPLLDEEAASTDQKLGQRTTTHASWLSRESAILLQNMVFGSFTFMVLTGTLYPLIKDGLTGEQLSVGEPYFDKFALPLGIAIVFLMGVGPVLPWGRAEPEVVGRRLLPSVLAGALFGAFFAILGFTKPLPLLALFLVGFAFWANFNEFLEPVRKRMAAREEAFFEALPKVWTKAQRRWGGHIAHYGILLMVFSLALTKGYRVDQEFTLRQGESVDFQGFEVMFEGARSVEEQHLTSTVATFQVEGVGEVEPRINFYKGRMGGNPIFTPKVHSTPTYDLYFSLMNVSDDRQTVIVRVIHEPAQVWLWIGGLVIGLGTAISLLPMARRQKAAAARPAQGATA